jgi:hypothetical protein
MTIRSHLIKMLVASACLAGAAPAFADYSYDFSSQDGNNTSTPITIGPATFSSTGGASNAFYFGPNAGLYTTFGSEVLSEAGNFGTALQITFSTPQSSVGFDFSLGDFFASTGDDTLTVTTSSGAVLTANAVLPSNGDFYPEGYFSLAGPGPVTSLTLTATEPITIADMTSVSAVPLPASFWLMGSAVAALGWFARRRRVEATGWLNRSAI